MTAETFAGKLALMVSAALGSAGVVAQVVTPEAGLTERWGAAGLIVAASAVLFRFFQSFTLALMARLDAKDKQIEVMSKAYTDSLEQKVDKAQEAHAMLSGAIDRLSAAVERSYRVGS